HALLCRAPPRAGGGAEHRPPRVQRRARPRGRRARRRRAGLPGAARGWLGRTGGRGDGRRRHRRVALGGVRGARRAAYGRARLRLRCVGRTDDMLIVRGVNVFPAAVREVVGGFAPEVSGQILVKPLAPGPRQDPPLPVSVELAPGATANRTLADAIRERLREVLVVQTSVELVPWPSLERSEYKS